MELQFLTPTEVWEGFNPIRDALETSMAFSTEKDNLVCSGVFFTSESREDGKVRAFARLHYDARWKDDRPVLLLLPTLSLAQNTQPMISELIKAGYFVCELDYAGSFSDGAEKTTFPPSLKYASYPSCMKDLNVIVGSARNSAWFQWSKIARRAISFLSEHRLVDSARIALLGAGIGAQIAWQVAGMDGRVAALAPINGGGYLWRQGSSRFAGDTIPSNDEERAFSTGVGAETYARFVSCPTCYVVSSNSSYADIDRAGDILSLVPTENRALMISKGTDSQINKSTFRSLLHWLDNNLAHHAQPVSVPHVSFEKIEDKLYLRTKSSDDCENMTLSLSYGDPLTASRYWISLSDGQMVDKNEYIFHVPVYVCDELIVAFCSVSNGEMTVSSPVISATPSKLGILSPTVAYETGNRLLYNSKMPLSVFSARTESLLLDDDCLQYAVGPFDIGGVRVTEGMLVLYLGAHENFSSDRDAVLQFDAYSEDAREIFVSLVSFDNSRYFSASVQLDGGDFWQKIPLAPSDFKSADGKTLSLFAEGKKFIFSRAENVIFNNFLWI